MSSVVLREEQGGHNPCPLVLYSPVGDTCRIAVMPLCDRAMMVEMQGLWDT